MKYYATVSDTNERIEANSFKAVYIAARHIARSNERGKTSIRHYTVKRRQAVRDNLLQKRSR